MMTIDSLHHVSVNVTDLARARRFYREVLGLVEIPRPDFDFAGAWYGAGGQQVHLIVHGRAREGAAINSREPHFALRVRSYRAAREHLTALGIPCSDRPTNKTSWPQIYITDPDGNLIELNAERVD